MLVIGHDVVKFNSAKPCTLETIASYINQQFIVFLLQARNGQNPVTWYIPAFRQRLLQVLIRPQQIIIQENSSSRVQIINTKNNGFSETYIVLTRPAPANFIPGTPIIFWLVIFPVIRQCYRLPARLRNFEMTRDLNFLLLFNIHLTKLVNLKIILCQTDARE